MRWSSSRARPSSRTGPGSPPTPNATLTFEIELLDFHSISIGEIVLKNGAYLLQLAAVFGLLHYVLLPHGALHTK